MSGAEQAASGQGPDIYSGATHVKSGGIRFEARDPDNLFTLIVLRYLFYFFMGN